MRMVQRHRWVAYDLVLNWGRTYSLLAFHVAANRSRMRADYLALESVTPFTQITRFPSTTVMVDVEHRKFGGIVRRIMNAADVPSRFMEKQMLSCSGRSGQGQQPNFTAAPEGITNLTDAKRSWDKGFEELMTLLHAGNENDWFDTGIFDREMFESYYQIVWHDNSTQG
ncbi:uncharacterized protein LOC144473586 isoform X2 [Augochlora pura]